MIYDFIDWCDEQGRFLGPTIFMCVGLCFFLVAATLLGFLIFVTKGWVLLVLLIVPVAAIYGLVKYFVDKME